MNFKNKLEHFAGEACKMLFPIHINTFKGHGSNVSLCTLSSIDLLIKISNLEIMHDLLIAGRLHSENKGIDQMIDFCINNPQLKYVILCGKDTKGHYSGDALISLIKNGIDINGKILGTIAPSPFICSNKENVTKFKNQVSIIDMRNCFDIDKISETVNRFSC
ncbi:MAG: tetrahydromethanopterin S-methyltransferase subunit A [Candidatus Nitrosocosmicus sp.]